MRTLWPFMGSTFDPTTYTGALTAGTFNGNTITPGSGTLDLGGNTVTFQNGFTFGGGGSLITFGGSLITFGGSFTTSGTTATTLAFGDNGTLTHTFPITSATLARTDAAQSFNGLQTFEAISAAGVALTNGTPAVGIGSNGSSLITLNFGSFGYYVFGTGNFVSYRDIIPDSSSNRDLGVTGARWRSIWGGDLTTTNGVSVGTTLAVAGASTLTGLLTANGGITIGSGQALKLGNAYAAGVVVSTGSIIIKDSAGTAYRVLCAV